MRPRTLLALATILALALAAAPTPLEAAPLGQIARGSVRVNGTVLPFGATLYDGVSLSTGELSAVLYLSNRQTVQLTPNSSARLFDGGENRILVELLSGGLVYATALGEAATIEGSGSVVVSQGGGQIGEGAKVKQDPPPADVEEIDICVLLNTDEGEIESCMADPKQRICRWQFQSVPPEMCPENAWPYKGDEVAQKLLGKEGVRCKKKAGPLILGAGLLGSGGVGLAAGAIAGIIVIDDTLDLGVITDEEASPVR